MVGIFKLPLFVYGFLFFSIYNFAFSLSLVFSCLASSLSLRFLFIYSLFVSLSLLIFKRAMNIRCKISCSQVGGTDRLRCL